ncbi:MAG: DUF530 family protein [Candidatus Micrarchaeota archaeon]
MSAKPGTENWKLDALPSMAYVQKANELLRGVSAYDGRNVAELEELKERMGDAGFGSPFRGLVHRTMEEADEHGEAEWADLKKQMSHFRYVANLKKYSLARVSIALDAHRVARGFMRMGYGDMAAHLPLDGNHIRMLMEAGDEGVVAYRELMDRMEQAAEKKGCFLAKVKFGGETETIQVAENENLELKVSRMFGVGAEVVATRPGVKMVPIISSKGVRVSLVSSIVHYAARSVGAMLGSGEGEVGEYNAVLGSFGIRQDARMDLVEGFGEAKAALVKRGFLAGGAGGHVMREGLKKGIAARRKRRREEMLRRASLLLVSPIFKFYLTNNEEGRRKENLYPSLAITPGESHMMLFSCMETEGVPARAMLKRKLGMEGSVPLGGKELGAAVLLDGGKDARWVAEYLGVDAGKAHGAFEVLRNFKEGKRGAEFVRRIKSG